MCSLCVQVFQIEFMVAWRAGLVKITHFSNSTYMNLIGGVTELSRPGFSKTLVLV